MESATITTDREQRDRIHKGAKVIGPAGNQLGRVFSHSTSFGRASESYMIVERKILFYRTGVLYIPLSAVEGVSDGKVMLKASHAEIGQQAWERPPALA